MVKAFYKTIILFLIWSLFLLCVNYFLFAFNGIDWKVFIIEELILFAGVFVWCMFKSMEE